MLKLRKSFLVIVVLLLSATLFQACSEQNTLETVKQEVIENTMDRTTLSKDGVASAMDTDTYSKMTVDVTNADKIEMQNIDTGVESNARYSYFTFRTLNKALRCTQLAGALFSGDKTVYAPSDAAFAKLGLNEHNICQLDQAALTNILLYHVVGSIVPVSNRGCSEMLNGDITQTQVMNHRLFINASRIYAAFQLRGNNYKLRVYAINSVLEVPTSTIVQTASGASQFSTLVAAVLAANPAIAAKLSDEDEILTVFAPTNAAFGDLLTALNATSLSDLVSKIGVTGLNEVLLYHVVDACAFSNDLQDGQALTTLQGEDITVDLNNLELIDKTSTPAGLVPAGLDILNSNGIVHTIDKVLLPNSVLSGI